MSWSMTLDVWAGDWGLPSIDLDCLRVMTYARFCGAPVTHRVVRTPYFSPSGKLPVFRHGPNNVLTDFDEIVSYLHAKNFGTDLSKAQSCETVSYSAYLEEKLLPALLHTWWLDEKNCLELSRPWYAKTLRLPFNFFYPGQYQHNAKLRIDTCYIGTPNEIETQIFNDAEQCLNNLSQKLGDSQYFGGTRPFSLDATVFAYLAPLLRAPFPSNRLQNHLKNSKVLVEFCKRISQNYFENSFIKFDSDKKKTEATSKETEEDFPNQKRNWLVASIFATAAMTGYLFSQGMLQISLQPQKSSAKRELDETLEDMYLNQET
ncbi:metaxin-1 [Neocloeon triangulifer]|uniref:metaxin-1 n=1 Tax=Neocloeon triangulifer TaxID=2078957 RepID=UPI00286EC4EB|nr:metaxin-1 [Neocloeon triangulifer]